MKNRRLVIFGFAFLSVMGFLAAYSITNRPITIHARIAENGGFMPDYVRAEAGEPLRLRLISEDVEHTFALGQNPMDPILLKPGELVDITLLFDQPGKYTFYSTTSSSPNFWRMRGTIEVTGDGPTAVGETPLYVRLGLDLDKEHDPVGEENNILWSRQPSAQDGSAHESKIPTKVLSFDYYITHSPLEVFNELRGESSLIPLDNNGIWSMVAFIWQKNTSPTALSEGQRLYQVNCAACHGKTGAGDGQFANDMKIISEKNQNKNGIQAPIDFTDPEHLIEAKPAVLQGKILRGGMGTGMPMWGSIFTDEQMWNLVAYLYTFQFK